MTDVYIWWQRYRLYRGIAMIFTFLALLENAADAGRHGLASVSGVLAFILALTAGGITSMLAADWLQDRRQVQRRRARHSKEAVDDDM